MKTAVVCAFLTLACSVAPAAEPDWLDQPTLTEQRQQAPEGRQVSADRDPRAPGENLIVNGDFETGGLSHPIGWKPLDNLTTRWVDGGPSGRGKCLRIDTDVYLSEWQKNNKNLASGRAGKTTKTQTRGDKYDTVAGTHGVHIYSRPIRVQKDEYFMLSVAMRGPSTEMFFPKVFVKGYRMVRGKWEEVWRGPLHCRTDPQQWREFRWKVPKCPYTFGAQEIKVILYAYWPPGFYQIDDVQLWRVDKDTYPIRGGPVRPRNLTPLPKSSSPPTRPPRPARPRPKPEEKPSDEPAPY